MGERRILVIGSQCDALGHLPFLPKAAEELYAVMTDPERGACVPALEEMGLLIDPDVAGVKQAIESAYLRAAKAEATLFIAYIGHGATLGRAFYLLPKDAKECPLTSQTAVPLITLILETHLNAPGQIDGLGVLLDTCQSGKAGIAAAEAWVTDLEGTLRFDMLTAASDQPAVNGCFSRTLTKLLREGIEAEPSEFLLSLHVRPFIGGLCPNQVPQNPSWNVDHTLWLSRNVARALEPWGQTALADEIQRLTLAYQPTLALSEIVKHSKIERCVAVLGEAGSGKSALAAALGWPKVTEGIVPARFVQAIAFIDEASTPYRLASTITQQLARSVPGFSAAHEAFEREMRDDERRTFGILEKRLVGPLKRLAPEMEIRLVVDALDCLSTDARGPVIAALEELVALPFMRLLVTSRPDTKLPRGASIYLLARAPATSVHRYLATREIPEARREEITEAAEGSWLVVRVFADLLRDHPDAEIQPAVKLSLWDAYDEMLGRCGASREEGISYILEILAAAGAGSLLPLSLLCKASEALGGPATPAGVRDLLVQLRGLAVRSSAGTEREQAGLFHQTLAEHVAARAPDKSLSAHRAIILGIGSLVPAGYGPLNLEDPIQRYAFEREAEHLWAIGETEKALERLSATVSPVPRDNLRRWATWEQRVEEEFGASHHFTLATRGNFARWTGECGDPREALRLFRVLRRDYERVLSVDHRGTLMTRHNIAAATAQCGHSTEALRLYRALLPDQERVLGTCHPDTLLTKSNIARTIGERGESREALRLFRKLLIDEEKVFGPDHCETLRTRANIAAFTGLGEDAKEGLRLFQVLLPDQERALGHGHPAYLRIRHNIAYFTGLSGNANEAVRLFQALLPDQERVLGAAHPDTLATRYNIAYWTAECADHPEALRLSQALLPEVERAFGCAHPETLRIKSIIAVLIAQGGDLAEAVQLFRDLLPPEERMLTFDHPDTLTALDHTDSFSNN
jgi:hypothetical protein